jgi:hypothetical protein
LTTVNIADASLVHPRKAFAPIVVTVIGIDIVVSELHFSNALAPIEVQVVLANPTFTNLVQSLNALAPILVAPTGITALVAVALFVTPVTTLLSIVNTANTGKTVFSLGQFVNASVPILPTLSGMFIDARTTQFLKASLPIDAQTEPVAKVTVASLKHSLKAETPILVTLAGIVIDVRAVQPRKA